MAEPQFREIQLSGKQLVFLFMTTVVLAVVVFLLGVSVGRGARGVTDGLVEQAADVMPPDDLPPPTEMTAADLQYHDTLKQQVTPPVEPEPVAESPTVAAEDLDPIQEPVPDEEPARPAAAEPAPPPPAPAPQPRAEPARQTRPAPARQTRPAEQAPARAQEGWQLQVGAYSSRENADRQVALLRSRNYNAFVMSDGPGNLHRVRVGPYADRAEADRAAARLLREEGLRSSVIR
jgi:DedD protein